jgi:hypothetical protein
MEIIAMANQEDKRTRLTCFLRHFTERNFGRVATQKEVRDGDGAIASAGAGRGEYAIPT